MPEIQSAQLVKALVGDGYDEVFRYSDSGRPGQAAWGALEVVVRPALADEMYEFQAKAGVYIDKLATLLVKHLVGWNIAALSGDGIAPIDEKSIRGLKYPVQDWIADCVIGYAGRGELRDAKN